MIDPVGLAVVLAAPGVLRLAGLLVQRGVLRDRAELVRCAAALPPGTRIVVRQADGDVMLVAAGPDRDAIR